jgi:hypothetical protein
MICDLCKEDSSRIIRVASWQVCQWCVSNNVLDHALEVEADIVKLEQAVAESSATHQRDVTNETTTAAKLQLAYAAYAELTTAMHELAASSTRSAGSLSQVLAARKALEAYKGNEQRKTDKARHGKVTSTTNRL